MAAAADQPAHPLPDRILVKRTGDAVYTAAQDGPAPTPETLGWEVLSVPPEETAEVLARLQADPTVAAVEFDYPILPAYWPNDPAVLSGAQWALTRLQVEQAWDISTGAAITVAVLDSGIDTAHPDLAGRWLPGYNFFDDNHDITDRCGHGTHVAGIVAAAADNGEGISGMAPQAILLPVKVIGDECFGSYGRMVKGIEYAVAQGARVIVISSGGLMYQQALHDAVRYARAQGVLVVVAAGNQDSRAPFYPGSFAESFTVAGTDTQDGAYAKSNYGEQIDVAAPAVHIYSTYVRDGRSDYTYMTGTSMAAPHVGGLAALILAVQPAMPVDQLEHLLRLTADDLGAPGWDEEFGAGRINAARALQTLKPVAQIAAPRTLYLPMVQP
ncbi:MAG TPA: S8 family serine peptidase [Caldilineaceae bacterium]|nr:S8 family serine peptidase [Caldilineaceae bacterium]